MSTRFFSRCTLLALALAADPIRAGELSALLQQAQSAPRAARFETFAPKLLEAAKQSPQDAAAADALIWIVANDSGGSDLLDPALDALQAHAQSDKLGPMFRPLADAPPTSSVESLLRAVAAKNPDASLQTQAAFALAQALKRQLDIGTQIRQSKNPVDIEALELINGKELITRLKSVDYAKLSAEAEALYEKVLSSGGDARAGRRDMASVAKAELNDLKFYSIGQVAPETEGEGVDGKHFKLSDHRGKIVVLFFWGDW